MDFGLTGNLDGKPICLINGSGSLKHARSDPFLDLGTRVLDSKMPKLSDDFGLRSNNYNNSFTKQQMLSFSNGIGSGNLNGGMYGSVTGVRGPFTPAQWIELEHQAMIYKYFTANVPVPANLLLPIRKAFTSSGFPGFSLGSYFSHSYGWGSFHLGFPGSTDPEPGRCRRTDGKKWRCSRDAVPDQKYCERHINRGRHRSRKPVEGHIGQASSGPTNTNTKGVPPLPASMSSLVTSHGSASNSVTIAQHQITSVQPPGENNISGDPIFNRFHDQQGHSVMPPAINLQSKNSAFSVPKQLASLGDSLQSGFGVVSNDPLLNPSHKSSNIGYKSYNSLLEFNAQQNQDHHSLRHFMDNRSSHSAIAWPEEVKSDGTQISMLFPMSSALSSAASSPNEDKMTISPFRLTSLFERSKTGLEVSIMDDEIGTKQNACKIPIAWGNSTLGGPLGEVLNNAGNAMGSCKSPQLGASPTGVLHKSTFVSLSNNSPGGSPKRDNM